MAARNHIEVVEKAMRVLEILADGEGSKSLRDISSRAGLVKSTAFRILYTLRSLGYVERNESRGTYSLDFKVLSLAHGAKSKVTLSRVARRHLIALRDALDESVWLAERRANGVFLVDAVEGNHPLRLLLKLGDPCPLHAAAAGKAVAAFMKPEELVLAFEDNRPRAFTPKTLTDADRIQENLAEVRNLGYSINNEETVEGGIALGAPIFDSTLRVCAAISVTAPVSRWRSERLEATASCVRDSAQRISEDFLELDFRAPDDRPSSA